MGLAEDAVACFQDGFNCAQAVFSAFAPGLGLERELALRVGGAFGGGMARMGEVCGAVTGGLMALGLRYGKYRKEDDTARDRTYELGRQFLQRFRERHGALRCSDLLGHDISTPEGRQAAQEKGLFRTLCPVLVREAAEIVEGLL